MGILRADFSFIAIEPAMSQTPHSAEKHDKHFYDSFMVVLGLLVAVAVVLIVLARMFASDTQVAYMKDSEQAKLATDERLAPFAKLAVSGKDNSALEAPKGETEALADLSGDQVFQQACNACHGPGLAGAPKYGDKGQWSARIAQGMPTLYKHALEGFQGKAGFMPPRGGATVSDKSVTNAVDYMVAGSK